MLAGVGGFEPPDDDTKNRCLTAWLHPNQKLNSKNVCPAGFEPATYGLEIRRSIRLSYGHKFIPNLDRLKAEKVLKNGRGGQTRTDDPSLPKRVRYQTAPHPEF